jgi:3-hydroxyisobutyrate dehydrogenase
VQVVDTVEDRRAEVVAAGASWAGTTLAAVPAEQVLITVLPGNDELCAVLLDDDQLLHLERGGLWIDLTSAAPDVDAQLQAAAADIGVRRLDAGVGGGPADARSGTLTLYVGGTAEDLEAVRPLLDTFAERVRHVGGPGTGHLVKLLINQVWFGQAVALAEALLLGTEAGVSTTALVAAFGGSPADSSFVREYLPRVLDGDYVPAFELSRIVEELDSLERTAVESGTPWTSSARVAQLHREALAGFGDRTEELSVVAWLEHVAGRRFS